MGVGDKITYGTVGVVYISGKQSTSVWNVITATGTQPVATTTATVNSVTHAFASLNAAVGGNVANNATSTNFMNTSDLVASNFILNIPCYRDTGPDTNIGTSWSIIIDGYTTGPQNYIRIFTPTSTTTQVNSSQRHTGKYNSAVGYAIQTAVSFSSLLTLKSSYLYIDGLQIKNTSSGGGNDVAIQAMVNHDIYLSNNIFQGTANITNLVLSQLGTTFPNQLHIWNNLFLDGNTAIYSLSSASVGNGTSTLYNNTFYNNITGVGGSACRSLHKIVYTNNIFASTSIPISVGSCAASGTGYNSTASTSLGYSVSGGIGNDRINQSFGFFDVPVGDYSITALDTGALDLGTSTPSVDTYFPFSSDIIGSSRPIGLLWDIGAFEYVPAPDTTPPGRSAGSPSSNLSVGSMTTPISLNTNENATCKYSTSANTAYADMTNTFSTAGGTSHSTNVSGLSDGHRYHYYVRCQDTSNNPNTDDYEINFWVGSSGRTYADSCSQSDVQYAINAANTGDVVNVPAGTCTGWTSASALAVNKAVTVEGAGRDQTILQIADDTGSYVNPVISISATATVKSMTIQTGTTGNSGTAFGGSANGFRITDIKYINRATNINGYFVYFSAYGLIDNNDITGGAGNNELIFGRGPTDSWQTVSSMGGKNNLFVENNTFRSVGYVSDCNSNTRCVFRNNTITAAMKIDGHGLASNSPARGIRHMEVYNNTWTLSGTIATMELRGGTGMIFNNIGTNSGLLLHEYCATAVWDNCGGVQLTVADYPITDQIGVGMDPKVAASEPMYLWSNRNSGSIWQISLGYGNGAQLSPIIVANRDYYNEAASFNGTSGTGSGTLASRPATCTAGVGYWATDKGTNWDITNATANDGTLYKCTATNTWTASYVPYAYPHYLTATSTIGTNHLDIGEGARMFGNGKFYGIATTSKSGVLADLSVTPGTNADGWVDISISTWTNTGSRRKVWTESMPSLNSTTTVHIIGDLANNTDYDVKVDGVRGANITGASCTNGICTSNGSGQISFTYSGGYSSHEFEVIQNTPDITSPTSGSISFSSVTQTSITALSTGASDDVALATLPYQYYNITSGTYSGATSTPWIVSGLTANTSYTFKIGVQDLAGNWATSTTYTQTTLANVPEPTPTPTQTPTVTTTSSNSSGSSAQSQMYNLISSGNSSYLQSYVNQNRNLLLTLQKQGQQLPQQVLDILSPTYANTNEESYPTITHEISSQSVQPTPITPTPQTLSPLQTLPTEFTTLVNKFPELGKTLISLASTTKGNIVAKLQNIKISGLSSTVGSSTGIPISSLTTVQKQNLPTEVVFAKSGDIIDYNVAISVGSTGTIEQTMHTVSGKAIDLALKPSKPVKTITGYLTVKNISRQQAMRAISASMMTASIGSLLTQSIKTTPTIDTKLVLQTFTYTDPDKDGIYTAHIDAPVIHGEYDVMTIMEYKDSKLGAKEFHLTTVVDPEGYVYKKSGSNETRIHDAVVSILWKNPKTSSFEIWDATKYNQINPQKTDITGMYSFLVPEGAYKLTITATGYSDYVGSEFQVVQGAGIHENIEMKTKGLWGKILGFLGSIFK